MKHYGTVDAKRENLVQTGQQAELRQSKYNGIERTEISSPK